MSQHYSDPSRATGDCAYTPYGERDYLKPYITPDFSQGDPRGHTLWLVIAGREAKLAVPTS